MNLVFIRFFFLIFFLTGFSYCAQQETESDLQIEELLSQIKKVEYSDANKLKELSNQLLNIQDSTAQHLGLFYKTKAEYYGVDQHQSELVATFIDIYPYFKTGKYHYLRPEIDLIIIEEYYQNLKYNEATARLKSIYEYIFQPEYDLERILLHQVVSKKSDVGNEDERNLRIAEAENIIEKYETAGHWNAFLSRLQLHAIWRKSLDPNISKRNVIAEYQKLIAKNETHGILTENSHIYNEMAALILHFDQEKALDFSSEGIALVEKIGLLSKIGIHYKVRGHIFASETKYAKVNWAVANEFYKKAIKFDSLAGKWNNMYLDKIAYGWSLYKMSPKKNIDIALKYLDKGINIGKLNPESTNYLVWQMALERKVWLLNDLRKDSKLFPYMTILDFEELRSELRKVRQLQKFNREKVDNFFVSNAANYDFQQSKIEILSLKKEADRVRIFWATTGIAAFAAFSMMIFYFYTQRMAAIKKLNDQNNIIAKQNNQLAEANSILENKKAELKAELKSKLLMLSNNSKALKNLENYISKEEDLNQKSKKQMLSKLKAESSTELIKEIDFQFLNMYDDFYKKLAVRHPDLTTYNLKLCTYLKMNLTTKEIATLRFSTIESVKMARNRLRKKLKIENPKVTLSTYLNSF